MFVQELQIEKEKYDELLQKYQAQSKERNSQVSCVGFLVTTQDKLLLIASV